MPKNTVVNPNASNRVFHDISGERMLSEEMKSFGEIAQRKRIDFIKARFTKTSLGTWQPIGGYAYRS